MNTNQPGQYEQRSTDEVGTEDGNGNTAPPQENSQIGDAPPKPQRNPNQIHLESEISGFTSLRLEVNGNRISESASSDQLESSYTSSGIGSYRASIDQQASSLTSSGIDFYGASNDHPASSYPSSTVDFGGARNYQKPSSFSSIQVGLHAPLRLLEFNNDGNNDLSNNTNVNNTQLPNFDMLLDNISLPFEDNPVVPTNFLTNDVDKNANSDFSQINEASSMPTGGSKCFNHYKRCYSCPEGNCLSTQQNSSNTDNNNVAASASITDNYEFEDFPWDSYIQIDQEIESQDIPEATQRNISHSGSSFVEPNSIRQLPTPNSTTAEARAAGRETHDLENPIQAEGFLTSYWSGELDGINNVSSLNSAVDFYDEVFEEDEARPLYASDDELLREHMPIVLSDKPNTPTVFDDNLQPQQNRIRLEDGDHLYDTNLMDHQDGAYANINIKEERRRLRMQRMCVICFERPRQAVNNPCQCVCYCLECARIMAICDLCLNDIEIP